MKGKTNMTVKNENSEYPESPLNWALGDEANRAKYRQYQLERKEFKLAAQSVLDTQCQKIGQAGNLQVFIVLVRESKANSLVSYQFSGVMGLEG